MKCGYCDGKGDGSGIPCKGYQINSPNQYEFDCEYPFAGDITCEQCIVNGGLHDPRNGKIMEVDNDKEI